MKICLQCLCFLFLLSCNQKDETTQKQTKELMYFDLLTIIQKDLKINSSMNCKEEKTVIINQKKEKKSSDSVNWENEFQLLMDCDINKPNWIGKFDSIISDDGQKLTYFANSSKIPVKKMTIQYDKKTNRAQMIIIDKKVATLLFTNEQQIIYIPGKSFKITAKQSAIFMNDFNSDVEIKYLCNQ